MAARKIETIADDGYSHSLWAIVTHNIEKNKMKNLNNFIKYIEELKNILVARLDALHLSNLGKIFEQLLGVFKRLYSSGFLLRTFYSFIWTFYNSFTSKESKKINTTKKESGKINHSHSTYGEMWGIEGVKPPKRKSSNRIYPMSIRNSLNKSRRNNNLPSILNYSNVKEFFEKKIHHLNNWKIAGAVFSQITPYFSYVREGRTSDRRGLTTTPVTRSVFFGINKNPIKFFGGGWI